MATQMIERPVQRPAAGSEALSTGRYVSVTSFKRDGTGVATPLWFVSDGRRLFALTDLHSAKVRRIRRNPRVLVAPCRADGKLRGEPLPARAEVLTTTPELERVQKLLLERYKLSYRVVMLVYRLARRLRGQSSVADGAALAITLEARPVVAGRRRAHALIATLVLLLALAVPGAAPAAFSGRNGDVLYSKQLVKPSVRWLDLYAIWPVNGYPRRVTRTPNSHELDPAASPDGSLIAYTRILRARPGSQIWAVRKNGSHQRFIARGSEPAWSPDGKRIVFVGPRQPRVQKPEIYIMRADGTHIRRLTRNWNASDRSPAFSPDGKRIVFLSNRDATGGAGNAEIWVMDTKGRHAVNLTRNPAIDDHPAWSPDGSKIVFERVASSWTQRQLFVMNADGSDQHQLGALAGSMPTWSPDGKQIAYVSGDDIFRANADGSGVSRVARAGSKFDLAIVGGIDWRVRRAIREP